MEIEQAIAQAIANARCTSVFITGESAGPGSMGTFASLADQDAWGNKPVNADKAAAARTEVRALTGADLSEDYVVTNYVRAALRASKTRQSAYQIAGISAPAAAETVAATYTPGATLTANVVPADREATIAKAGNVLAGLYRGVTVFNAKAENNLNPAQKSANLDQCVPGTLTSYREAGEIARALGVKV